MRAQTYYKGLIFLQISYFVGFVAGFFDPTIGEYRYVFLLLSACTLLSKINILLETKLEADPNFWEMRPPRE